MREIRDAGKVVGVERVAIMAALNITHELLTMRVGDDLTSASSSVECRAMTATIDAAMAAQNELF